MARQAKRQIAASPHDQVDQRHLRGEVGGLVAGLRDSGEQGPRLVDDPVVAPFQSEPDRGGKQRVETTVAQSDHAELQLELGRSYLEGAGVDINLKKAFFWLSRAKTHSGMSTSPDIKKLISRLWKAAKQHNFTKKEAHLIEEKANGWKPTKKLAIEAIKEAQHLSDSAQ